MAYVNVFFFGIAISFDKVGSLSPLVIVFLLKNCTIETFEPWTTSIVFTWPDTFSMSKCDLNFL